MAGWIKIHRDLDKHWLSKDMEKLGRWIDLLILANYEDKKTLIGEEFIIVKRGEFVTSYSFLANRWNCSKSTVSKFIELLESDGMISKKVERKATILTICNYDSYQQEEKSKSNDNRTIVERLSNETKKERNKEINNIINNSAPAHTCTCEEFAERYRRENMWSDIAVMIHARSIDDVKNLFEEFVKISIHDGKVWEDFNDFKKHFRQWATYQMPKRLATQPNNPKPAKRIITSADIYKEMGL